MDERQLSPRADRVSGKTLFASDRPCAVLIHENLDPSVEPNHIVHNAAEVRAVLRSHLRVRLASCQEGTVSLVNESFVDPSRNKNPRVLFLPSGRIRLARICYFVIS